MKNNLIKSKSILVIIIVLIMAVFSAMQISADVTNTRYGTNALPDDSGTFNTAIGYYTLYYNTSNGTNNTAIGGNALYYNTAGYQNTATGMFSLYNNTSGHSNVAVGYQVLFSNNTGSDNTALGSSALFYNTSGLQNTAVGEMSINYNSTGSCNSALGFQSLCFNTTGFFNAAVGSYALYYNTTGDYNTAVGFMSGPGSSNGNISNTGAFGNGACPTASNTIVIGNSSITKIGGKVGWSSDSDGRFKRNVKENVPGLDFIMKLKPVTYNWDLHGIDAFTGVEELKTRSEVLKNNTYDLKYNELMEKNRYEQESIIYTGFVAQDVEKAANDCGYDFSAIHKPENEKDIYSLSYAEFVVPMVKAMQEQQKQIAMQQKEIEELKLLVKKLVKR